MLKLLVVGTLRCGTAHTAQVLNLMGIPCGHAWVFGHNEVRRYPEFEVIADASPAAAPLARAFDGLVLHQVRDPLRVIGSLLGTGLIENPRASGREGVSIARQFPLTGNPIPDATRYQVDWNAHCERGDHDLRPRVEDLDVGRLGRIAAPIGRDVDDDSIVRALEQVPTDFNTRHNAWPLGWDDLPDGPSKEALRRMAVRCHYPTD